jgi:6-phosphogluconate dehydrogenase
MTATPFDDVGTPDLAVIGLGRLGRLLATALVTSGFAVAAHERSGDGDDAFLRDASATGRFMRVTGPTTEVVRLLVPPRRLVVAVPAGPPVDAVLEEIAGALEPGDVIVDTGNAHHADTTRRLREHSERGILFLGAGVAGGDDMTGPGPALMVGGNPDGWPLVADVLRSIAGRSPSGDRYCEWVGVGGAGHFVKMVHNAVEYADMQGLAEAYQLMRVVLGLTAREQHEVFSRWAESELESYLVQITADILAVDDQDGTPILDHILDIADQHGTGAWSVSESLALGVPATLAAAAVHARSLSAMKDDRLAGSQQLPGPAVAFRASRTTLVDDLAEAVLATRIVSYTQAFLLLGRGSDAYGWDLDSSGIAALWQGSIVRSALLNRVRDALASDSDRRSLLLDDHIRDRVTRSQASWRRIVSTAAEHGVPVPAMSAGLAFYDGYRTSRLPADLIQAQRDYFAAHGYERIDGEDGVRYHTDWGRETRGA